MKADPGEAYHEIELAMDDPDLREAAKSLMREHALLFASLSGRSEAEVMAEAGMTLSERLPPPAQGRVTARFYEDDERRLVIWFDNVAYTIAVFPEQSNPVASGWQSTVIRSVVKLTQARTWNQIL